MKLERYFSKVFARRCLNLAQCKVSDMSGFQAWLYIKVLKNRGVLVFFFCCVLFSGFRVAFLVVLVVLNWFCWCSVVLADLMLFFDGFYFGRCLALLLAL